MNNPSRIGFHSIILTLGIGLVSSALAQTSSPDDQRFEPTTEPVLREEAPPYCLPMALGGVTTRAQDAGVLPLKLKIVRNFYRIPIAPNRL